MVQDMEEKAAMDDLLRMAVDVVVAYVRKNQVPANQISQLIQNVFDSLSGLEGMAVDEPAEMLKPATPIRKSVTPDYIICLEDGKKLKMLKRHLRTTYQMTPDEYRAKWNLPPDYPMVAPNYALQRSEFAKTIGLGKQTRTRVRNPRVTRA